MDNEIKIENGIPLSGKNKSLTYPFAKLQTGDSFFIPGMPITRMGYVRKMAELRTGFKFTCRTVEGGVRVWRIQ